jgi:hypothetical protein
MEEIRNASKILARKTEAKRPKCRWEDNIKMDIKEIWCGNMDSPG